MADQLYLSLWFPNFRLEALPAAVVSVMRQFALISSSGGFPEGKRVSAASAYPISFSESPTYQRLYVNDPRAQENQDTSASIIETAVAEATEHLHDDMAYEFEMKWNLWTPDSGPGSPNYDAEAPADGDPGTHLDTLWRPHPTTVRVIGFGPHFDDASFEQNGHVRVDFGLDYPWVLDDNDDDDDADGSDCDEADDDPQHSGSRDHRNEEEEGDDSEPNQFEVISIQSARTPANDDAAVYIQKNVELLLAFTLSVEKQCGISSRLLWTESGEPLAEKLISRLQRLN